MPEGPGGIRLECRVETNGIDIKGSVCKREGIACGREALRTQLGAEATEGHVQRVACLILMFLRPQETV